MGVSFIDRFELLGIELLITGELDGCAMDVDSFFLLLAKRIMPTMTIAPNNKPMIIFQLVLGIDGTGVLL